MAISSEFTPENGLTILEDGTPFVHQPTWPDGTPWESEEQAIEWATAFAAHREDPTQRTGGPGPDRPLVLPMPNDPPPEDGTNWVADDYNGQWVPAPVEEEPSA